MLLFLISSIWKSLSILTYLAGCHSKLCFALGTFHKTSPVIFSPSQEHHSVLPPDIIWTSGNLISYYCERAASFISMPWGWISSFNKVPTALFVCLPGCKCTLKMLLASWSPSLDLLSSGQVAKNLKLFCFTPTTSFLLVLVSMFLCAVLFWLLVILHLFKFKKPFWLNNFPGCFMRISLRDRFWYILVKSPVKLKKRVKSL